MSLSAAGEGALLPGRKGETVRLRTEGSRSPRRTQPQLDVRPYPASLWELRPDPRSSLPSSSGVPSLDISNTASSMRPFHGGPCLSSPTQHIISPWTRLEPATRRPAGITSLHLPSRIFSKCEPHNTADTFALQPRKDIRCYSGCTLLGTSSVLIPLADHSLSGEATTVPPPGPSKDLAAHRAGASKNLC